MTVRRIMVINLVFWVLEIVFLLSWPEKAWNLEKTKLDSDLLGYSVTRRPERLIYKWPYALKPPGSVSRDVPAHFTAPRQGHSRLLPGPSGVSGTSFQEILPCLWPTVFGVGGGGRGRKWRELVFSNVDGGTIYPASHDTALRSESSVVFCLWLPLL